MTKPSKAYAYALVQILDSEGRSYGTGVAVGGRSVLTCAHVAAAAVGAGIDSTALPEKSRIWVRRPYLSSGHSEPQAAALVWFVGRLADRPDADLALFELVDPSFAASPTREADPPPFDLEHPRRDDLLLVSGFPADRTRSAFKVEEASYVAGGEAENGWIQLTARSGVGGEIRPGFSGAPVWSERRRAVVGIITEADEERRTAAMIPASAMQRLATLPLATDEVRELETLQVAAAPRPVMLPGFRRLLFETLAPRLHFWVTARVGSLPDPPERLVLQKHMADTAARFEEELADKTYLPPPAKYDDDEPRPAGFRPVRQIVRAVSALSSGGDAANAHISSTRGTRRVRHLIRVLQEARLPLILLGDPGAGKSLTLQQVAIGLARQNRHRVFPDFCLFVRLGRWRPDQSAAGPTEKTVEALVEASCPPEVRPYLAALEARNRLIVIFDGMDEMSRYRYVDHTEALSVYARARQSGIRTLFSCRLADFSPNFRHRRLVLSPFDASHVRSYLTRQLGARQVEIDGDRMTIRALARRLLEPDLPIQANNPYVLFLLSLFIRDKGSIPTKRVELLDYYYRSSCERKAREIEEATGRPADSTELFNLWGLIALEITQRNQGSEVATTEIERLTPEAEAAIAAGRAAGVLVESRPQLRDAAPEIRFENHRAQEYFTAWHIAHNLPDFDWSGRLDAPRWQETLVNVAQMGAANPAISALSETMIEAPATIERLPPGAPRVLVEADAAERVDLAARVALDMPVTAPERAGLQEIIRDTADWFLRHGGPVSKVTMLRAIQRSPDFGSLPMIEGALNDRSHWIRERAHVVASRLLDTRVGESATREVTYAFAEGDLIGRLRTIMRLSGSLRSIRLAAVAIIGALLLALQSAVFASVGPVAAWGVGLASEGVAQSAPQAVPPDGAQPSAPPGDHLAAAVELTLVGARPYLPYLLYLSLAVAAFSFLLAVWFPSPTAWLWLIGAGLGTALVPLVLLGLWLQAEQLTFGTLMGGAITFVMLSWIGGCLLLPFVILVWASTTGLFCLAVWLAFGTRVRPIWSLGWHRGDFRDYLQMAKPVLIWGAIGTAATFFLQSLLGSLRAWGEPLWSRIGRFLSMIDWPLLGAAGDQFLNACLTLVALIAGYILLLYRISGDKSAMQVRLILLFFWAGLFGVIALISPWADSILETLHGLFPSWLTAYVVYGIILLFTACLIWLIWRGLQDATERLSQFVQYKLTERASHQISPEKLRRQIERAWGHRRSLLVSLIAPERLRLDVNQTIEFLVRLEPLCRSDPVLSAYQAKLAELLSERRQYRAG